MFRCLGFGVLGLGFWGLVETRKTNRYEEKQKETEKEKKEKKKQEKEKQKKKEKKKKKKKKTREPQSVRLRPISTSANFDFGQLAEVQLAEVELAEVEHPLMGHICSSWNSGPLKLHLPLDLPMQVGRGSQSKLAILCIHLCSCLDGFSQFIHNIHVGILLGWVHFHPNCKKKLIQKHFHPKTLSSKREGNFIHNTFIQKRVHPMTLSSQTFFIQP